MSDCLQPLWNAAHQASLSSTTSQSFVKFTSIESVMLFNHLILCRCLHHFCLHSKNSQAYNVVVAQEYEGGMTLIVGCNKTPLFIQPCYQVPVTKHWWCRNEQGTSLLSMSSVQCWETHNKHLNSVHCDSALTFTKCSGKEPLALPESMTEGERSLGARPCLIMWCHSFRAIPGY